MGGGEGRAAEQSGAQGRGAVINPACKRAAHAHRNLVSTY